MRRALNPKTFKALENPFESALKCYETLFYRASEPRWGLDLLERGPARELFPHMEVGGFRVYPEDIGFRVRRGNLGVSLGFRV